MSEVYTCPGGHQWQPFDEPLEARPDPFLCPVCGAGPQSEASAARRQRVKLTRRRLAVAGCLILLGAAVGFGAYRLWRPRPVLTLRPYGDEPVFSLAFSPDASLLLAGGGDGKLRLWEVPSGRQRLEIPAHMRPAEIYSVAFAPNGDWLLSGGNDGQEALWDAHTGAAMGSFYQSFRAFAVSPDGRFVASVGATSGLRTTNPSYGLIVWETATQRERLRITTCKAPIDSVAYSPDGARIATGEILFGVRLFDADSGRQVAFVPSDAGGLAFSPDGKLLAFEGRNSAIQFLDAASGRPVSGFPTSHSHFISCLAFSNNGKWLASGSGDTFHAGEVIISDAATGREAVTLRGHSKGHTAVAFTHDGRYLATASWDGTVNLWDLDQVLGPGR